jgi:hypothetical protein
MHDGYPRRQERVRASEVHDNPAGGARDGCLWLFDWFYIEDNPNFTSEPTHCPF